MRLRTRLSELEAALRLDESEFSRHQRELHCPIPTSATEAEFNQALAMLTEAHAALQQDIAHVQPLERFRAYAASLQAKYQGTNRE